MLTRHIEALHKSQNGLTDLLHSLGNRATTASILKEAKTEVLIAFPESTEAKTEAMEAFQESTEVKTEVLIAFPESTEAKTEAMIAFPESTEAKTEAMEATFGCCGSLSYKPMSGVPSCLILST